LRHGSAPVVARTLTRTGLGTNRLSNTPENVEFVRRLVIGAYPDGMEWDLRRGNAAERDEVLTKIRAVPVLGADPVHDRAGTLLELRR
jgi:uncharacterized protein YjlB